MTQDVWSFAVESVEIHGPSDVAVASARARRLALRLGASPAEAWELAIAVSEASANIHVHGIEGKLELFASVDPVATVAFEASDVGPGFSDVDLARLDGCSRGSYPEPGNATSLGCGIGAIERLMDRVSIRPGDAIGARVRASKRLGRLTSDRQEITFLDSQRWDADDA